MNVRKSLVVALLITLTGALLTVGQGLTAANSDPIEPWVALNPAGSYYGNHPVEPVAAALTVIPNDPECKTITCIQKIYYMDHTLGGAFPDVVAASDTVGMGARTGPNTWNVTLIRHAIDGAAGLQYMALITGDFVFPDDGSGLERKCTWALYLPEQDKDGDAWPDEDETPMICIPDEGLMPSMKILPTVPLTPPPMPEQ
jgi:hypothetical protein